CVILLNPLPGLITDTQVTLRLRVASFGGLAHLFKILPGRAVHAFFRAATETIQIRGLPSIEFHCGNSSRDRAKDGIDIASKGAALNRLTLKAIPDVQALVNVPVPVTPEADHFVLPLPARLKPCQNRI